MKTSSVAGARIPAPCTIAAAVSGQEAADSDTSRHDLGSHRRARRRALRRPGTVYGARSAAAGAPISWPNRSATSSREASTVGFAYYEPGATDRKHGCGVLTFGTRYANDFTNRSRITVLYRLTDNVLDNPIPDRRAVRRAARSSLDHGEMGSQRSSTLHAGRTISSARAPALGRHRERLAFDCSPFSRMLRGYYAPLRRNHSDHRPWGNSLRPRSGSGIDHDFGSRRLLRRGRAGAAGRSASASGTA